MAPAIRVEYLFSLACPSHDEGLERLHAAAASVAVEIDVSMIEIRTDGEAVARRFPGSPTYLIEGQDLVAPNDDMPPRANACRAYARPDGRVGPLPHHDTLAAALAAAAPHDDDGGPT